MTATRTSFRFFLVKAAKVVVIPFVVLDVVAFLGSVHENGFAVAWADLGKLVVLEILLWPALAMLMYRRRAMDDRFSAMQDEIEELKERISRVETR